MTPPPHTTFGSGFGPGDLPPPASVRLDTDSARRLLGALGAAERDGLAAGDFEGVALPGYTLVRRLGAGASGEVFLALREGSDRPVSVKVWRQGQRGERAVRAWRELDLLGECNLAVVPRVLDYGTRAGSLFVATDYIDGLNPLARSSGMSLRERVTLLADIADAVQMLHEHGIIHRDLKPANILVTAAGRVFILDLGLAMLAQRTADTLTLEGQPVGTLGYMSPEQARGERAKVSVRSDVYSLGAIGYHLLCGDTPHPMGESASQSLLRITMTPPRDPRDIVPDLPTSLAAILTKAVRTEPRDRYPSAAELGTDLRRYADGERVLATPPGAWQRVSDAAARHPVVATTLICAGVAGGIVGGAAWATARAMRSPVRVVVDGDQNSVQLRSASDHVLSTWNSGGIRNVRLSKWIPEGSPTRTGEGVIYVGPWPDGGFARPECMLFDPWKPARPVWHSGQDDVRPHHPPGTSIADTYNAYDAVLADVFPEVPDGVLEIIVTHIHSERSATVLRVYDLAGTVRFEAWHDGISMALRWETPTRQIVFAGVNSEKTLAEWGHPESKTTHPAVLFAVTPVDGLRAGWIRTPTLPDPPGDDDLLPNWYRYLGPSDEYPWSVHSMGLDEVPGGDGKRFRVTVGTEPDPHTGNTGSLFWYFDDKGNCTGRLTPSAFTQRFGEGADPKNFSWKSSLD